jgi:phosphatidylglycerol:prolipoprotein diacylglycerol transferase
MFLLDISPVAFTFGQIPVYWYGIIYALSIFASWKFACYIIKNSDYTPSKPEFEKFIFGGIIACIIGARLGHVLFFEFEYYISHPLEIIMIRNGGLSFHGGIIGIFVVSYNFCKKKGYNFKILADILSFSGAIGVSLGRIANFINQELYGTVTGVEWAVIFSRVDNMPRHPSQLYESLFEGLFSFWIMLIFWKTRGPKSIGSGLYAFIFMLIYSSSRYIVEFFKDVEVLTFFGTFSFTVGQILSIILFISAFFIINFCGSKGKDYNSWM